MRLEIQARESEGKKRGRLAEFVQKMSFVRVVTYTKPVVLGQWNCVSLPSSPANSLIPQCLPVVLGVLVSSQAMAEKAANQTRLGVAERERFRPEQ